MNTITVYLHGQKSILSLDLSKPPEGEVFEYAGQRYRAVDRERLHWEVDTTQPATTPNEDEPNDEEDSAGDLRSRDSVVV